MEKHLMDVVPFRLGSRVTIKPEYRYASDWRGVYVVVGMRWKYQTGSAVDIEIASDLEIQAGHGSTDGFDADDLMTRATEMCANRCHEQALEIERLTAEIERLQAALKDCADDLEASVNAEYAGTRDYPSQESKYQRDMRPVYAARHLLVGYQQSPIDPDEGLPTAEDVRGILK